MKKEVKQLNKTIIVLAIIAIIMLSGCNTAQQQAAMPAQPTGTGEFTCLNGDVYRNGVLFETCENGCELLPTPQGTLEGFCKA